MFWGVYSVNECVFTPMVLFIYCKWVSIWLPCPYWYNVFIPMVRFIIRNDQK